MQKIKTAISNSVLKYHVFTLILVALCGCTRHRPYTYKVILPNNYVGWVRADFGAIEPPSVDSSNTVTIKVGEDGKFWTNSIMAYTVPTLYEFYYQAPSGLLPVPAELVSHELDAGGITARSDDPRGGVSWFFFVGPKRYRDSHPNKDFLSHASPLPAPGRMAPDSE